MKIHDYWILRKCYQLEVIMITDYNYPRSGDDVGFPGYGQLPLWMIAPVDNCPLDDYP